MRWVLMLFVILAAVMGGEARAVVVMGRAVVSERVGRAETVEKRAEALRVESERAPRVAALEVQKAAGLMDDGPLALWFPGGLAVARSDCGAGQRGARPIEEVGLGDRVLTAEAGGAQESGTAVMDPASWRAYALRMTRVDLLRPAGWEQGMAQGPDGRRTIHLELPEMGVSGEAEVLAVSPCPPLEPGVGRVVTGTFRKERNHGLRALHVSVAGEVSCLRVTSGHPVWSVTRGAWIGAGELVQGEALAAWRGESVAVLANLPEADTATWNLEVENEHVYRVGPAGILVHNTSPTPKELFEGGGGVKGEGRTGDQARLRELGADDKVSSADRGWIKQEQNSIERGQRTRIRRPPGKELAHERGREAAKGYGYEHSNLQDKDLHKLQHKYDDFGRKNKERPVTDDD